MALRKMFHCPHYGNPSYKTEKETSCELDVNGTGSGSFIVVGFAISGVASSSSRNRELILKECILMC
jgi:hypothetical protein